MHVPVDYHAGEKQYPIGWPRMTYGFGFWQSGYRCLIPWIYQYSSGDPWNNLDGATADFFNRIADDGAPIPVPFWEAYREGIDDHRYIHTLEIAIERAIAAGRTEDAARARKLLDDIMASIEVQTKYKDERLWPAETFDAWRWAIAHEIIKLRE